MSVNIAAMPTVAGSSVAKTLSRAAWRYMPLLFILYVVAIIDRVNVGFAKLRMQDALGWSDTIFGIGAGIFFIGYFLFEVPSNMLLERVGARRWIARILIMWGPIAALTAFAQTPMQFYILRFLLGIGEAGLFPGIVLYLTYWFPADRRTRYIAFFMLGMPIAGAIIGPLSAAVINGMHNVWGIAGWQWMFIVQGLPALFLGIVVLFWLDDRPATAKWLTDEERTGLQLAVGPVKANHDSPIEEFKACFRQKGLLWFLASYFMLVMAASGYGIWLPQFLQDIAKTDLVGIGRLLSIIFIIGTLSMALVGMFADRTGNREAVLLAMLVIGAAGFAMAALTTTNVTLAVTGFTLAAVGYLAAFPVFWGTVTPRLSLATAAAAIAMINSIGNLGGAFGPAIMGAVKQSMGLAPSIMVLAIAMALSALFAIPFRRIGAEDRKG